MKNSEVSFPRVLFILAVILVKLHFAAEASKTESEIREMTLLALFSSEK